MGVSTASVAHAAQPARVGAVVHGVPEAAGSHPYLVALLDTSRLATDGAFQSQYCGGTLVSATQVITAAHCTVDLSTGQVHAPSSVVIGVGPSLKSPTLQQVPVSAISVHPGYNPSSNQNDIAVLTLAKPVTGVPTLSPISAAQMATLPAGTPMVAVGWGNQVATGKNFPDTPQEADVVLFPDSACGAGASYTVNGVTFNGFSAADADPATMLCADGVNADRQTVDTCSGDSGGPLIANVAGAERLAGIVSWGQSCAGTFPGVYTRVAAMADFLKTVDIATTGIAPVAGPGMVAFARPSGAHVIFGPPAGSAQPLQYQATATDPTTGAQATCSAITRDDGLPPFCNITGLTNGTAYAVAAVASAGGGNSPVSAALTITPKHGPAAGAIVKVQAQPSGITGFVVAKTRTAGAHLLVNSIACTPLTGGSSRRTAVRDRVAIFAHLPAGSYSCVHQVRDHLGADSSDPVAVTARG